MARRPQSLDEAKQIFREEKAKVSASLAALAGSRWLMAVLATFALAFGSHTVFAPQRLPTIEGLSLAQAGLPQNLDFGLAGEQIAEARAAAQRENAPGEIEAFVTERAAENESFIPMLNWIGFGVAMALLLGNVVVMTKRRRVSRG